MLILDLNVHVFFVLLLQLKDERYISSVEREMFSYQAYLEIRNCDAADAGIYKVIVRNQEGEAVAKAPLLVAEKQSKEAQLKIDVSEDHNCKVISCFAEKPRFFLVKSQTPRQRYSPRRYYEMKNKKEHEEIIDSQSAANNFSKLLSQSSNFSPRASNSEIIENPKRSTGADQELQEPSNKSSLKGDSTLVQNSVDDDLTGPSLESAAIISQKGKHNQEVLMEQIQKEVTSETIAHQPKTRGGLIREKAYRLQFRKSHRTSPKIMPKLPEREIEINQFDELTLSCFVSGSPRPKVVWMKDAKNISNELDYEFEEISSFSESDSGFYTLLRVMSARSVHAGKYTTTAYNICGDATCEIDVKVNKRQGKTSICIN